MRDKLIYNMLKYDTTDKEPSIYDILILTLAAGAVLFFMVRFRAAIEIICAFLILYFLAVIIMMGFAYVRQIQCNPYSYNMIYYRGFVLFFLLILISTVHFSISVMQDPGFYTLTDVILFLADTAVTYVALSTPAVLIFSVWLCISNICLIRHEGKRLVNVLGIILSFLMIAGLLLLLIFGLFFPVNVGMAFSIRDLLTNIFAVIYVYFECMLTGAIAAVFIVAKYEPVRDKDFIIILGCRNRKDGTPTPLLRGRIDRALAFYKKQKAENGKELIFVTSGGKGPGEVISESASMKNYLMEKGIPEEQIIEENQSANTYENMKFSKEKIKAVNPDAKIAFSTTNYHVFRSGLYARRVKMRAAGMGQPTKWWFWPNASIREFVGLMTEHKKRQALILGSFAAVYTILTLLALR